MKTPVSGKTTGARIPSRTNIFLSVVFFFSQIYLLFLFPFAFQKTPALALAGLLVTVVMILPTWYLMHEAVHDHLHQNIKVGFWLGRLLSAISGVPFSGIRVAHLLHHRWNRIEDFSENYEPTELNWLNANAKYFFLILGGLYWLEFLGGLMLFLPERLRLRLAAAVAGKNIYMNRVYHAMNNYKNAIRTRNESILIAALYIGSFCAYGPHLRILLIAALCGRAFLVSLLDNSFHYEAGTNPGDNSSGTRDHSMPASWLILNFNYHWTHHKHPGAPWTDLPMLAQREGAKFEGNYITQAFRQFKGAIAIETSAEASDRAVAKSGATTESSAGAELSF